MIRGHLVKGVEHQGEVFECHLVGNWEPLMVSWQHTGKVSLTVVYLMDQNKKTQWIWDLCGI